MTIKVAPTPPQFTTIGQFSEKSGRWNAAAIHGDDPNVLARQLDRSYNRLDPLGTVTATGSELVQLRHALQLGRVVVEAAVETKAGKGKYSELLPQFALDLAQVGSRIGADSDEILTLVRSSLDTIGAPKIEKAGRFSREGVNQLFETLSARSLGISSEAAQLQEKKLSSYQRSNKENFLRASLGGLVQDSVTQLKHLRELFIKNGSDPKQRVGGLIVGQMSELAYFTFKATDWYKSGDLHGLQVRMALTREDKADLQLARPKRGFDVVESINNEPTRLVQVKSSTTQATDESPSQKYAEGIDEWHPNKPLAQNMDQIVNWFSTIVNNDASDVEMESAWRNLQRIFEPKGNS